MALIKATSSGSNYIQKTSTGADTPAVSAIQMYEKQVGSDGATSNTVFTLQSPYVIGSNTLMVFVNGQKIEKVTSATLTTEFEETSSLSVTIGASLLDADVVEFIVAGAYILDSTDATTLQKFTSVENIDVDTGIEVVDSFADTLGRGVFWFYTVEKDTNIRSGLIRVGFDASSDAVVFTETMTHDLGDTSGVTFSVDIDSNLVRLLATAGSDNWEIYVNRMILGGS